MQWPIDVAQASSLCGDQKPVWDFETKQLSRDKDAHHSAAKSSTLGQAAFPVHIVRSIGAAL